MLHEADHLQHGCKWDPQRGWRRVTSHKADVPEVTDGGDLLLVGRAAEQRYKPLAGDSGSSMHSQWDPLSQQDWQPMQADYPSMRPACARHGPAAGLQVSPALRVEQMLSSHHTERAAGHARHPLSMAKGPPSSPR